MRSKLNIDSVMLYRTIIFLVFGFVAFFSYSQQQFRRHYIIAYDVSPNFVAREKSNPSYRDALIKLFSGQIPVNCNESNTTNLLNEQNNNLSFFNEATDEISFFHFSIATSEFEKIQRTNYPNNKDEIVRVFNDCFLKKKAVSWSEFRKNNSKDISLYFNSLFNSPITPPDFGKYGVTLSQYVYPLILNKIDTINYAEEYILIILSDFLTGSMFGNKNDYLRLKEIYLYGTIAQNLPKDAAPEVIRSFSDELSSGFYKIDYFEFSFNKTLDNNPIGIIGYKIRPKAGKNSPEDVSIFIDSDLKLQQRGYKSTSFKIPETLIRFTHNENLKPNNVFLTIYTDKRKSVILFQDTIAQIKQGQWFSNYTSSSDLMSFDKTKCIYTIPQLKISLDEKINDRDFNALKFEYKISTVYSVANANPVNLIYKAERSINRENIIFATKTTIIVMTYVVPALVLIIALVVIVLLGKPKSINLLVNGYLDSYEKIDYKKFGKLHTPYKYWDVQADALVIDSIIKFKNDKYYFNWQCDVFITIENADIPNGFDLYLKPDYTTVKEYSKGSAMRIKAARNRKTSFLLCLRQNDINITITEPILIKATLSAKIRESRLVFFDSEIEKTLDYNFHIGEDLGDLWVGFDPGTTGSCVAVGTQADNIVMANVSITKSTGPKIMPSLLTFDHNEEIITGNGKIPEYAYKYGSLASQKWDVAKYRFQSIKKLLGFKDVKEIVFKNITFELTGKKLSSLLIQGLYKELDEFVKRLGNKELLNSHEAFDPKRAVIAIPNNFTISKIQDIVECIDYLEQFKEVRYVYEAEAVLFYYLSKYSRFHKANSKLDNDNILVFDMGGATINATVVRAIEVKEDNNPVYYIDFLGKIGYGIGGDTIDYCIIEFLLGFSDEYFQFKAISIAKDKDTLAKLAQELKIEMVSNYQQGFDYLITAIQLQKIINDTLNTSMIIDEESNLYKYFVKDSNGSFKLLSHRLFANVIYKNIQDAVVEVVELSGNCMIDTVIFSGRSTFFPLIKETVMSQLKAKNSSPEKIVLDIEESKTAVAHGACWYGINKNSIRLNNLKTNASFGFKKTLSADTTDVEYTELVSMGCPFDSTDTEIDSVVGIEKVSSDFAFDGSKVNFYQVMGKNADQILASNHKHKYSKIASIRIPLKSEAVKMVVNENDEVECLVKLINNQVIEEKGVVSDQEITDANEEHYTWIIN